jgi:hypothetical protein
MTLRYLTAAAVLASMAIHLTLWFQGMRDVHVIGPAFLLNVVGGLAIAALLVRWRHWAPAVLAACFGVCTLGAFTLAATVGLYGTHEHWQGSYVWAAAIAEVVAIAGALAILLEDPLPEPPRDRGGRRRAEPAQRAGRARSGVSS